MNRATKAALVLAAAGAAVTASVGAAFATGGGPGGAGAVGVAKGSPGVISGNVIQLPIQIPINLCGNSIDIVGLLNPTFGNTCVNAEMEEEHHEVRHIHVHHEGHHHEGRHHEGEDHED
ncbi:chaplin [Streptomyces sp. NPDC001262]|uniref:chaplin n=1 Tax=Streptomyces TaxID=1883 RepID=UPI003678160F